VWIVLCAVATKCLNDDAGKIALPGQAPPAGAGAEIGLPQGATPPASAEEKAAETPAAESKPADSKAAETKPSDTKANP
jgi:hypothetical protein